MTISFKVNNMSTMKKKRKNKLYKNEFVYLSVYYNFLSINIKDHK